jgi:uncharacterized protein (TIGR02444 family)
MTEQEPDDATESWAFALRIYAEPGVAEACLELQAEAGVDVMMLLVAAFAVARRHIRLSPADIEHMAATCRPWREQVVQPLRALRTMLKTGPSPAPDRATEKLRSGIKASELAAERLENDLLAEWLRGRPAASQAPTRKDVDAVLRAIVANAMRASSSDRIDALLPAIDTIVAAIDHIAA